MAGAEECGDEAANILRIVSDLDAHAFSWQGGALLPAVIVDDWLGFCC